VVNILGAVILANNFGLTVPPGNPNCDINNDGVVNILDAVILSNNFLQHHS
jgi:hypothetical protein